jgi:uncharacterized protein YegL
LFSSKLLAEDTIVVVFDTSGSMDEFMRSAQKDRMAVAKQALIEVLSKVPPTTKIGVLTFDGWAYKIAPVEIGSLTHSINSIVAQGGTPLYEFISQGATELLKERENNLNVGYYKLVVVTDGEAGDGSLNEDTAFEDGSFRPGVLKDVISRGIIVDTIALDMKSDHSLKTSINGAYMSGDDPESLKQSLAKAVAEVGFGDSSITEEAFKELTDVPDTFATSVIEGLSTFKNVPIGETAPVIQGYVPQTQSNSATGGFLFLVSIIVGIFFVCLFPLLMSGKH